MKKSLRIYLADDHTLFRKAIANFVGSFDRVSEIKEAANGKELIALIREKEPDVAFVDLQMPVMDGSEACEYILSKWPAVKLIVLTMHDSEKHIRHMMELGVHAFIQKNAKPEELKEALYSVVDKDFYYSDMISRVLRKKIADHARKKVSLFEKALLTRREQEILRLIYDEYTVREISDKLSISENTVRNHRVNIMRKTGVHTTAGLIKYAYEAGLSLPEE